MSSVNLYIDLLRRVAVRGVASASPAPTPDFRRPQAYTLNLYFLKRADTTTENYAYTRFATGTPMAKLRRNRAPEFANFTLDFGGYTSPVIDARLSAAAIAKMIGSMPSVGLGNVLVTGDYVNGFNIEFTNSLAGFIQPLLVGHIVTPSNGELLIKQVQAGGFGANSIQSIQIREAPLAVATGWTEIGVPATPGWSATLDTTAVPQDVWEKGDLTLEVSLDAQGVRTGTDGITALEGTTRSGVDGQTVNMASVAGAIGLPAIDPDGNAFLVAMNAETVYGRLWSKADIGRIISDGNIWITSGTVIKDVIDSLDSNIAILDKPFLQSVISGTISFNIDVVPSRIYQSVTGAFVATDVGHAFTGTNIPAGTVVEAIIDSGTVLLSKTPTVTGTGLSWTVTAIPGAIFQSATATFSALDVGARLDATQVPASTYITQFIDSTHVILSQKAIMVASGQTWTLRSKLGFAPPSVSSIQTGSLSQVEKQKVALTQQPAGGFVTFRDGADASLPVVVVPAPITVENMQNALNAAYPNFGGITVQETLPNAEFTVTWGTLGKQFLMVVDETGAVYESVVAQVPLGVPAPPTFDQAKDQGSDQLDFVTEPPNISLTHRFGLYLFGVTNLNYFTLVSQPEPTEVPDGTKGWELKFRLLMVLDLINSWTQPSVGSVVPYGGRQYYFDHKENQTDQDGIRQFDWVGYSVPPARTDVLQQNRPIYIVPKSFLNGHLVDMQIASVSASTWVRAVYSYKLIRNQSDMNSWALPTDGPFGTIIHFVAIGGFTGQEVGWAGNGFDLGDANHAGQGTLGRQLNQSWTRKRWRANIWKKVLFQN